jgi:hypothetical protein
MRYRCLLAFIEWSTPIIFFFSAEILLNRKRELWVTPDSATTALCSNQNRFVVTHHVVEWDFTNIVVVNKNWPPL